MTIADALKAAETLDPQILEQLYRRFYGAELDLQRRQQRHQSAVHEPQSAVIWFDLELDSAHEADALRLPRRTPRRPSRPVPDREPAALAVSAFVCGTT